jgi:hypothetical protein
MKYHSFPAIRRPLVILVCVLLLSIAAVTMVRVRAQDGDAERAAASKGFRNNPLIFAAGSGDEAEQQGGTAREFGKDIDDARDSPPDLTPYAREMIAADRIPLPDAPQNVSATVVDVIVNNTDINLRNTDTFGDSETNIAINPLNPNEIVITAFSGAWGTNAPLFHSTDGGINWTKRFTVPVPPAVGGSAGCPCDQSVDYGRSSQMSGTYLTSGTNVTDVYSGTTTNPAAAASWGWFTVAGSAKRTNSTAIGNTDQPWLLINRDPFTPLQDNVYVAYDDFSVTPQLMRVAVSTGANPPNFVIDNLAGIGPNGFINPGHRLAVDRNSGAVYSLFQQYVAAGSNGDTFRNINFMLNRSTDGGVTWTLNGSTTGIVIANANSTQPRSKFGTVNALLGGVDHAAVDPTNGDVYYVYGDRDGTTGNNRLSIKRLTANGSGGLTIGPQAFVTGQVQAALPSVSVNANGVVSVFYYTYDGIVSGFPQFTAHLASSADHGLTFPIDTVLETFLSSSVDNANTRQRVLGDYQQVKSVGNTFYGSFCGNGVPFGRTISNHDPIFFKVSMSANLSGRVISAGGRGIRNATVTATGADGSVFTVRTGPNGVYQFTQLPMGPGYSVNVAARRFTVSPRTVNLGGDVANFNFVAQNLSILDEARSIR